MDMFFGKGYAFISRAFSAVLYHPTSRRKKMPPPKNGKSDDPSSPTSKSNAEKPVALNHAAYSPDLNPIEMSFSKLKSVLRKRKIRDIGKLKHFLKRSTKLFSKEECQNYIRHAGYCLKYVKRSKGEAE
jgi:hypothetical protein